MRDKELYAQIPGIKSPWQVSSVELALSEGEPDCHVQGNLQMLQRTLANLLDNAFKYSEPDSRVTVSVNAQDHAVQLSVRDEGIGITQPDLKKVFDRYFRCDESRSKSGCGFGLSLVRAVTMAHGGHIDVNSTAGAGSVFRITLPA